MGRVRDSHVHLLSTIAESPWNSHGRPTGPQLLSTHRWKSSFSLSPAPWHKQAFVSPLCDALYLGVHRARVRGIKLHMRAGTREIRGCGWTVRAGGTVGAALGESESGIESRLTNAAAIAASIARPTHVEWPCKHSIYSPLYTRPRNSTTSRNGCRLARDP